jgi:hypothetical protein
LNGRRLLGVKRGEKIAVRAWKTGGSDVIARHENGRSCFKLFIDPTGKMPEFNGKGMASWDRYRMNNGRVLRFARENMCRDGGAT